MEKIKKYIKPTLKWALLVLLYFSILTVLGYTGVLKLKTLSTVNLVFTGIVLCLLGINLGKKTSKKGFLEGLKLGSIVVFCIFILNLIFYRKFNLQIFLYYLLLLTSPTIGGILGINMKR